MMKSIYKVLLAILSICVFSAATAGNEVGGGHGVICSLDGTVKSVSLLDYYESKILLPDLGLKAAVGATAQEKLLNLIKRISKFDPERFERFSKMAQIIESQILYVSHVKLPEVNDYAYIPLEDNCEIRQVAVQRISPFPQAKFITMQKEIWDRFSIDDQAGLLLHEIIYQEARELGQPDSRNSRYLTALISSASFEKLSASDYEYRLKQAGFRVVAAEPLLCPKLIKIEHSEYAIRFGEITEIELSDLVINGRGSDVYYLKDGSGALKNKSIMSDKKRAGDGFYSIDGSKLFIEVTELGNDVIEVPIKVIKHGCSMVHLNIHFRVVKEFTLPKFKVNPIHLGTFTSGQHIDVYLSNYIDWPKGLAYDGNFTRFGNLPNGMTLENTYGRLSGTTPLYDKVVNESFQFSFRSKSFPEMSEIVQVQYVVMPSTPHAN